VDKRVSHRLVVKDNDTGYFNPTPGTCVDSGLVENMGDVLFDFLLIAHRARVGAAIPVHYMVVYNNTGMLKRDIETLTYHLCHGYFNFRGRIKVPASCMYAHKVAKYTHDIGIKPNPKLAESLHYL
jgi:aubergine-like protein